MGNGPIWLVGMMGAGKSTVGARIAIHLGRRFVDTDAEIERDAGATVAEIFEHEGEAAFRQRERAAIEAHIAGDDVIALGGGAIAQPGAAERLGAAGTIVYLRALPETLLGRLGDCATRPLLRDLDDATRLARVEALLAERRAAYETADLTVDTDARDLARVVDEVCQGLEGRA